MTIENRSGETLTCTSSDCACELQILTPCPHGDRYTCACGNALTSAASKAEGIGARAEAAGVVDQQAVLADETGDEQS